MHKYRADCSVWAPRYKNSCVNTAFHKRSGDIARKFSLISVWSAYCVCFFVNFKISFECDFFCGQFSCKISYYWQRKPSHPYGTFSLSLFSSVSFLFIAFPYHNLFSFPYIQINK